MFCLPTFKGYYRFGLLVFLSTCQLAYSRNPEQLLCTPVQTGPDQALQLECEPFKPVTGSSPSTSPQAPLVVSPEVPQGSTAEAEIQPNNTAITPVGEEPVTEDISRLFLSESEVLLKSKEVELSFGFSYSKNDSAQNLRLTKGRTISIPLGLSIGLSDKMEAFTSLPLLYTEREYSTFSDATKSQNSGIGDLNLGLSYRWLEETPSSPSFTTSLSYTFATGEEQDENDPNDIGLTTGFENLAVSLSLTKSVDPAVLFFTLGYEHSFAEDQQGFKVQPGDSINYGLGAGFSINNQVSLSWRVNGSYSEENKVNGEEQVGSSVEPVSLTVGGTYQITNKKRLQADVSTGLNDEASDVAISISYGVRL